MKLGRAFSYLHSLPVLALVGWPAWADTAVLTPAADTYITQQFPNGNNTGATELTCGTQGPMAGSARNRALFKFDPGHSIPAGADITAARFSLVVTRAPDFEVDSQFELHRVLRDWNVDETTWKLRSKPDVAWFIPGGASGLDYSSTISASTLISEIGPYAYDSTPAAVADVQSWLDNPASNFGWILISDQESQAFSARRIASVDQGADLITLEVEYTSPPPPKIEAAHLEQGRFSLQFDAQASYCYTVEFLETLGAGSWTTLTNVCAKLVSQTVVAKDPDPVSAHPARFYRIAITGRVR